MKYDEFAFFNQQLAGMVRSGIPLEGALRQLCGTMKRGKLRSEFEQLEADLGQGVPLDRAIGGRQFPEFYVQMVRMGAKTNDLPGVLMLVADYYHRANSLSTRLKGLMIYPAIVLFIAVSLSLFLAVTGAALSGAFNFIIDGIGIPLTGLHQLTYGKMDFIMLLPTVVLCLVALGFWLILVIPKLRNNLRWRISGFKEASLANLAASVTLMLRQGADLNSSLGLIRQMESRTPLGAEMARWQNALAAGRVKITDLASGSRIVPPLFFWMVASEGENWANGFARAAEVYHARALNKSEMLLFAALPVSVLVLGLFVVGQVLPLVLHLVSSMGLMFGGFGDGL